MDQVKRLSKAFNPKNWKFSRAAAAESEVTLPPPGYTASGILTLALQPPQAAANVYQGDVGDCPSLQSPKSKKQDSETAKKGEFTVKQRVLRGVQGQEMGGRGFKGEGIRVLL